MLGNTIWIFIGIAVVVWIMSNMIRSPEEERAKRQQADPDQDPSAPRPRSTATNDIDRFLEEVNRRRREAAEQQGLPSPTPTEAPRPRRTPPPLPVTRAVASARRGPTEMSRELPTSVKSADDASRARERPRTVAVTRVVQNVLSAIPVAEVVAVAPVEIAPTVAAIVSRPTSPVIKQVRSLLRSPQSLRTAFVLQEVLGRPRCMRRR